MHARESVREDAAAQERAELALDEGGQALIRRCAREEGLELALQHGVEGGVLGFAAAICVGARRGAPRDSVVHACAGTEGSCRGRAIEVSYG